jgi:hypothetical protein
MLRKFSVFLDKAGDSDGGGDSDKKGETSGDHSKSVADLTAANAALIARLEKLEAKYSKSDDSQDDLATKVKKQKDIDDKKDVDSKALEAALKFSLKSDEFIKTNAALLPKEVAGIFKAAESEKYDSAIEKDAAIKSGIIQSFFSIQSNLDLLTPTLKSNLEDYLKLTKDGKQQKAQTIYDSIFEPAFEMLRRVKKAEALSKGLGNPSETDDAYKNKLIAHSRKHYLGEKSNA